MLEIKETMPTKYIKPQRVTVNGLTQLTIVPARLNKGITLKNLGSSNTDIVYVGDKHVTVANGFPLIPNAELTVPFTDPSECFLTSAGSVPVSWFAL